MGTVVAHERHQFAVVLAHQAGLNVAEADQRPAGRPGLAPIVGDRHDRGENVSEYKRQDPAPGGQHDRMNPRHPAQPLVELIRERSWSSLSVLRYLLFSSALRSAIAASSRGQISWA